MLLNYTMVNYDSLRGQIQEIDENYPCSKPTWLRILTTTLGTLMIGAGITFFLIANINHFNTSSILCYEKNPKETKVMPLGSSHQLKCMETNYMSSFWNFINKYVLDVS